MFEIYAKDLIKDYKNALRFYNLWLFLIKNEN